MQFSAIPKTPLFGRALIPLQEKDSIYYPSLTESLGKTEIGTLPQLTGTIKSDEKNRNLPWSFNIYLSIYLMVGSKSSKPHQDFSCVAHPSPCQKKKNSNYGFLSRRGLKIIERPLFLSIYLSIYLKRKIDKKKT